MILSIWKHFVNLIVMVNLKSFYHHNSCCPHKHYLIIIIDLINYVDEMLPIWHDQTKIFLGHTYWLVCQKDNSFLFMTAVFKKGTIVGVWHPLKQEKLLHV